MMRRASRVKWLTYQVTSLSESSRMDTGVSKSISGGGCGATTGEVHGLHVTQQEQGGGDQGGPVGAVAGSARAMTGSDNGDANETGSMAWSGSLALARWTQSTCFLKATGGRAEQQWGG
jgi:hypothetical protein